MTPEEYDQKYKSKVPLVTEEFVGLDGMQRRPRITVINSTAEEMYKIEMDILQQGGADYGGREQITSFMRGLRHP
jgi:hypothetical protein